MNYNIEIMSKEVIRPELPPLSPEQARKVNAVCNRWELNKLLHYLETGELKFEDMPNLSEERKAHLVGEFEAWKSLPEPPNPKEQTDWLRIDDYGDAVSFMPAERLSELKSLLYEYIGNYSGEKPSGHHLDEAKNLLSSIKKLEEQSVWENVDKSDFDALRSYLEVSPQSPFGNDAESRMWYIAKSSMPLLPVYKEVIERLMPNNDSMLANHSVIDTHLNEANSCIANYANWKSLRDSDSYGKIFKVKDFLYSPAARLFYDEVERFLQQLKSDIMYRFKSDLNNADLGLFCRLLDEGIFTESEFIQEGLVSETSLKNLRDDNRNKLELIDQTKSVTSSPGEHTDVFLFGIPSTGKTCVVMGLTAQPNLFSYNSQIAGGKYGDALNRYLDYGALPQSTSGNFVTLLSGEIPDDLKSNVKHPVNIIDMAGEAFAETIADNPDEKVSFEDMGIGATELLKNGNDKVFFLIIDPTSDFVQIGTKYVRQKDAIKGMISLFQLPENKCIMEKVKAIHIILTKADTIGEPKGANAKKLVTERYADTLTVLKEICKEGNFAINAGSDYLPKLYTFSLGKFYLGGVYDYDPADSRKLLKVIRRITCGQRERNFLDKVKDVLNKTIG